mmetsp:Transcript_57589/g.130490  ORF Transcript_57589/g.130490 Transcript_57589/m.130490 type:complete len:250 (+) Transcript_57589:741-1490(+)
MTFEALSSSTNPRRKALLNGCNITPPRSLGWGPTRSAWLWTKTCPMPSRWGESSTKATPSPRLIGSNTTPSESPARESTPSRRSATPAPESPSPRLGRAPGAPTWRPCWPRSGRFLARAATTSGRRTRRAWSPGRCTGASRPSRRTPTRTRSSTSSSKPPEPPVRVSTTAIGLAKDSRAENLIIQTPKLTWSGRCTRLPSFLDQDLTSCQARSWEPKGSASSRPETSCRSSISLCFAPRICQDRLNTPK